MYDKSVLDGNEVDLYKLRAKSVKNTPPPVIISDKERLILDYLCDKVSRNNLILERDIRVKGVSKALAMRTVKNEKLLKEYKLRRVRLDKNIKDDLGIDIKGYPFILLGS